MQVRMNGRSVHTWYGAGWIRPRTMAARLGVSSANSSVVGWPFGANVVNFVLGQHCVRRRRRMW